MRAVDVIIKKRQGRKLTRKEIEWFIGGYLRDEVADYQASALLMAAFLKGLDFEETAALTEVMMRSGDVYNLDELGAGRTVDKHSTGGVGDKVSLILAPLVAACGVVDPMVSGRGLGHSGGTLDKLESIPGFNVRLTEKRFREQLHKIGVAMIGQSDNFVPADKRLYALRDVTGTIESIPLICASIMSKKVASGAHAIVMDVKTGTGAFMETLDHARALASNLAGVGKALGRPVRSFITDMNQPLGRMVGNSLEVIESIDCLKGGGPADLRELTVELAAEMILLSKPELLGNDESGHRAKTREMALNALDSGTAWERFRQMVVAQEGDVRFVDDPSKLNVSKETELLKAPHGGFIGGMDCRAIGNAAVSLGAGRAKTKDTIDPGVGIEMMARIGDKVEAGAPLAKIYHRGRHGLDDCLSRMSAAFKIGEESVSAPVLIKDLMN